MSVSFEKNKICIFLLLILFVVSGTRCSPGGNDTSDKTKTNWRMATIFSGTITDKDFNYLGYQALLKVQKTYHIETAYQEQVSVDSVKDVMGSFIKRGFNIIWTHGGQYQQAAIEMAEEFPDIAFIVEGDDPPKPIPENVWFIDRNLQDGFYELGFVAVRSSGKGVIGYLGGEPFQSSLLEVNAISQAIRDQNPNVELKIVWANDFNDPEKAETATRELIDQGCDVIISSLNLGTYGMIQVLKENPEKVLFISKFTDKSPYAPEHAITALLYDFSVPLDVIIKQIKDLQKKGYYPMGYLAGVTIQSPFLNVDPTIETDLKEITKDILKKKIIVEEIYKP